MDIFFINPQGPCIHECNSWPFSKSDCLLLGQQISRNVEINKNYFKTFISSVQYHELLCGEKRKVVETKMSVVLCSVQYPSSKFNAMLYTEVEVGVVLY